MNRLYIGNGYVEVRPDHRWYGTTEYWNSRIGFIPKEGTIIIYEDAETVEENGATKVLPALKIGTGRDLVQDLPFLGQAEREAIAALMDGAGDKHFSYEWRTLQTTVAIRHNLHKRPSVTVTDTAGTELFCDVAYNDEDNVTLTFSEPVRGTAYFN
jgi:hypothetical protein